MPGLIVNSLAMVIVIVPLLGCALLLIWSFFGVHVSVAIWRSMTLVMLVLACLGMAVLCPEVNQASSLNGEIKLYSELTWVRAETAKMWGPGVFVQLMLDRYRIPLLATSSLLFFCLSWSGIFGYRQTTPGSSRLARMLMLAAWQLSTTIFLLADDMISLLSSLCITILLICGLQSSWGEAERRKGSIEVFGNLMTSSIFIGLAMLLIVAGLTNVSPTPGLRSGLIEFSFANLAIRLARSPMADPLLANVYGQVQPLALLCFFIGLMIWSGMVPFHRWLMTLYRQLPLELFALTTLSLSTGLVVLISRILIPFLGETVHSAVTVWLYLAIISISYLSLLALAQTELRRLLAVSIIRDLLLISIGLMTIRESGSVASRLLSIQLPLWISFVSSILIALNSRYRELDSSSYSGLWSTSPKWSKLWLTGVSFGYGIPLLGMFPSRALIFLSLSRLQVSGVLWLLFLFLTSELIISWAWWRVTASMLWGNIRLPVASGPVFDRLPGGFNVTFHPLSATSSVLTTSAACVILLTSALVPGVVLQYWDSPRTSTTIDSSLPAEFDEQSSLPRQTPDPVRNQESQS